MKLEEFNTLSPKDYDRLFKQLEEDPEFFISVFLQRKLSPKQEAWVKATKVHKHVVAIWSRQTGKSTVIASYIVHRWLYGKGMKVNGEWMPENIVVAAPIKEQVANLYDKIRILVDKIPHIGSFIEKLNRERGLVKNGNKLTFLSASPGSNIRGATATMIVIDETQDIIDSKYYGDLLPMGATTNALILEAGTPKTKNHFWATINSKSAKVITQKWFECPFLDEQFVMDRKASSPEALWRQEFLGEFIEEGVICFPSVYFEPEMFKGQTTGRWNLGKYEFISDVRQITDEVRRKILQTHEDGARYTSGLDLGKSQDNSVYTIFRVDTVPIRLKLKIVFPLNTNYKEVAAIIGFVYNIYQPFDVNVDYSNEKGFIERLWENNVPVIINDKKKKRGALPFTVKNKTEMITAAQMLLEAYQLCLPKGDDMYLSQWMNQQYEVSEQTGQYRYYHPSNEHDDQLWSSLLALKNISTVSKEEIIEFVNPWERFDEVMNKPQKDVLAVESTISKAMRQSRHINRRSSLSSFTRKMR